jgi:uncharacterized protein
MRRLNRFLLPAALAALVATPLAAQEFSDAFTFLKAVRDRDGAKVQEIASNPSSGAINARDQKSGEGALHILVQDRNLDFLAYLLGRGARPDIQSNDGTTPLALAARLGWIEGATQLLARGARVDLANQRGETPLILAVQAKQLPVPERLAMIQLLIGQGADPTKQDSFAGYSALDYAKQDGRAGAIVAALEAAGKSRQTATVGPNP